MRPSIWTIAACAAGALLAPAVTLAQTSGAAPASPVLGTRATPDVIRPASGPDDTQITKRPQGIDAEFVDTAGQAGKRQVQASQLALEKAASPDVRAFAKRMVADYGALNARLRGLGARKGLPVQTVQIVDPDVEALRGRNGPAFDAAYVAVAGPDAHRHAIRLFEDEAHNGRDPDLRAFASGALPTLMRHLAAAQALVHKVGAC
ncbi:DUF305 domain-containing protein [Burkholderia ubonensis]|uniref:DUF305 domain-containing protein n=1 Tax=Burkholderia ubonensis TaxID=101571 RepID=A0AAW3MHK2_9BURK|nr:DUF4142 domain-containing protein [Burkholderia ubonensis]KVP82311.1 DUF305 domain-containing protein [Burkholderia ubonensis]KVZ87602.1 DUF305 domain-containing protein [Burkholderia ubonensis]KWD61470.1 DUF305 domain-containing protein [Burkholderia ubonensis]KWD64177.1 DUF305 domain-containing protein [Burkholderia ubonensis]